MIKVAVPAGKYVVAVSGGIDSMVLLDVLAQQPDLELVVAHFNHGIRADANVDQQLVVTAADRYGLVCISGTGALGPDASEATARAARYDFLARVRAEQGAQAIITAHHQDDVLETAIINIIRGTGRKGLSALRSHDTLLRPLLHVTKAELTAYAADRPTLVWHEDSTNGDERYLRNYIRHQIVPRFDAARRHEFLAYIETASHLNTEIDHRIGHDIASHSRGVVLERRWFVGLSHAVSREVMAAWLRQQGLRTFDRKTIERLTVGAKVSRPGKRITAVAGFWLEVGLDGLKLEQY